MKDFAVRDKAQNTDTAWFYTKRKMPANLAESYTYVILACRKIEQAEDLFSSSPTQTTVRTYS